MGDKNNRGNSNLIPSSNSINSYNSINSSYLIPSSKEEREKKKKEILSKGFPAVFEDMSKMKKGKYFNINKDTDTPLHVVSLKGTAGIYMITNKLNKNFISGCLQTFIADCASIL